MDLLDPVAFSLFELQQLNLSIRQGVADRERQSREEACLHTDECPGQSDGSACQQMEGLRRSVLTCHKDVERGIFCFYLKNRKEEVKIILIQIVFFGSKRVMTYFQG